MRRKLNSLFYGLTALQRAHVPRSKKMQSMPVRQALTFIVVAQHPGITPAEMQRFTNASSAVTSRDLLGLGKRARSGKPGLGLIRTVDARDLRLKQYYLTSDGLAAINRAMAEL